jgi:hypothetical protein
MSELAKGRLMIEAYPTGATGTFQQWEATGSICGQIVAAQTGRDESAALRFLAYELLEDLAIHEFWGTALDDENNRLSDPT